MFQALYNKARTEEERMKLQSFCISADQKESKDKERLITPLLKTDDLEGFKKLAKLVDLSEVLDDIGPISDLIISALKHNANKITVNIIKQHFFKNGYNVKDIIDRILDERKQFTNYDASLKLIAKYDLINFIKVNKGQLGFIDIGTFCAVHINKNKPADRGDMQYISSRITPFETAYQKAEAEIMDDWQAYCKHMDEASEILKPEDYVLYSEYVDAVQRHPLPPDLEHVALLDRDRTVPPNAAPIVAEPGAETDLLEAGMDQTKTNKPK